MSFKDRSFEDRYAEMGDQAETIFEQVFPQGWSRYGLNRPRVNLNKVAPFVRYTPDYLTASKLVEVQGVGQDQTFKLKMDKLHALEAWDYEMDTTIFVWDSFNQRYGYVDIDGEDLRDYCNTHGEVRAFPEGKKYWALGLDVLSDYLPTRKKGPWTKGWTHYVPDTVLEAF